MGLLVIKRKRQMGKSYSNNLKVVIDDTQIVELSNGETKKIELSDGPHSVKLSYYFKLELPIPLLDALELNCNHQEIIDLQECTQYTVSIEANQFKITHNGKQTRSNPASETSISKYAFISKNSWWALAFLFLCIGIMNLGVFVFYGYITSFISIAVHMLILLVLPPYVNFFRMLLCRNISDEELKLLSKSNKKFLHLGLITFGISTAIILLISFLLPDMLISYVIMSSVALLTLEILVLTNRVKVNFLKIMAIINIVAILLSLVIAFVIPSSNSLNTDNEKCGVCDGSGYVPNNSWGWETCPRCRGTGIPPI